MTNGINITEVDISTLEHPKWLGFTFDSSLDSILNTTEFLLHNEQAQAFIEGLGYKDSKDRLTDQRAKFDFKYSLAFFDNQEVITPWTSKIIVMYKNNFTCSNDMTTFLLFARPRYSDINDFGELSVAYGNLVSSFVNSLYMKGVCKSEAKFLSKTGIEIEYSHKENFFDIECKNASNLLESEILPYVRRARSNLIG